MRRSARGGNPDIAEPTLLAKAVVKCLQPSPLGAVCLSNAVSALSRPLRRIQNNSGLSQGRASRSTIPSPGLHSLGSQKESPMIPDPVKTLIQFEIPAIISVCGLLFVAAIQKLGHPLWAIPAMTLFSVAGMALFYALHSEAEHPISKILRQKKGHE